MAIQLRVIAVSQVSPYSCWWACTRMILHYHGGHRFVFPYEYRHVFAPPTMWGAGHGTAPMREEDYAPPPAGQSSRLVPAYRWYTEGIPPDRPHLDSLIDHTDLRPVLGLRSSAANWMAEPIPPNRLEQHLRDFGPIMLVRRRGDDHHAILVIGITQDAGGPGRHRVDIIDPDRAVGRSASSLGSLQQWMAPHLQDRNILVHRRPRAEPVVEYDDLAA